MTKPRPAAKSPSTAIARVLKDLGLKQGRDFRVRGQYEKGERVGTHAVLMTSKAEDVVADNANGIEVLVRDGGWSFNVSIHYFTNGRRWAWVANYGPRVRETAPVTPEDAAALDAVADADPMGFADTNAADALTTQRAMGVPYPGSPSSITDPAQQAPAEAKRQGLTLEGHPYDGLVQKAFDTALTWACEEPGQLWFFQNTTGSNRYTLRRYNGRAEVNGWYLSGPGIDRRYMGATLTLAAQSAEFAIVDQGL